MKRVGALLRRYGLDVLIAITAIEIVLEVTLRYGAHGPATAMVRGLLLALIVLPLLTAALPCGTSSGLVLAGTLVYRRAAGRVYDHCAVAGSRGISAGQPAGRQAGPGGLAVVIGGAASSTTTRATPQVILSSCRFVRIGWSPASRAAARDQAERRRRDRAAESGTRDSGPNRRGRGRARNRPRLHDVVAHAVSVMVLRWSRRHRLPQSLAEDKRR